MATAGLSLVKVESFHRVASPGSICSRTRPSLNAALFLFDTRAHRLTAKRSVRDDAKRRRRWRATEKDRCSRIDGKLGAREKLHVRYTVNVAVAKDDEGRLWRGTVGHDMPQKERQANENRVE